MVRDSTALAGGLRRRPGIGRVVNRGKYTARDGQAQADGTMDVGDGRG